MSGLKDGKNDARLIRPLVRNLHAYVPGEQPAIKGLIKLNTNENPYPPSPHVMEAMRSALDGRMRLYPSPRAEELRRALARHHDCGPENIIIGNGSDELLALATRAFVEPTGTVGGVDAKRLRRRAGERAIDKATIQYFSPSYSLYPVLADIHGGLRNSVPLDSDYAFPSISQIRAGGKWRPGAALTYITTPNAPSGRGYSTDVLAKLCRAHRGVVILDEAYVDFAEENAAALAGEMSHVLVSRTFSKAYSLCFLRIGYFIGPAHLIAALDKVRDSYNVNGIAQVAALATLEDLPYYRARFERIKATRTDVTNALQKLGWTVLPSATNFVLAQPPGAPAEEWFGALRENKILVRWFQSPEVSSWLRISIGSEEEMARFLRVVRKIGRDLAAA